jgi:hypothetical protein
MAQYHVTIDSELLQHLFLSDARDSGVSKLLESILNQILEAQATEQLRAAPYERTEERQGYRNGTYPHTLTTRVGSITLRVPRLRNGKFSTELFSRYQRSEQAFILALMEMVVNGVSTRKVAEITEELCGTRISKSHDDKNPVEIVKEKLGVEHTLAFLLVARCQNKLDKVIHQLVNAKKPIQNMTAYLLTLLAHPDQWDLFMENVDNEFLTRERPKKKRESRLPMEEREIYMPPSARNG